MLAYLTYFGVRALTQGEQLEAAAAMAMAGTLRPGAAIRAGLRLAQAGNGAR